MLDGNARIVQQGVTGDVKGLQLFSRNADFHEAGLRSHRSGLGFRQTPASGRTTHVDILNPRTRADGLDRRELTPRGGFGDDAGNFRVDLFRGHQITGLRVVSRDQDFDLVVRLGQRLDLGFVASFHPVHERSFVRAIALGFGLVLGGVHAGQLGFHALGVLLLLGLDSRQLGVQLVVRLLELHVQKGISRALDFRLKAFVRDGFVYSMKGLLAVFNQLLHFVGHGDAPFVSGCYSAPESALRPSTALRSSDRSQSDGSSRASPLHPPEAIDFA